MRTGFARHIHAFGARLGDQANSTASANVNDMQSTSGSVGEIDGAFNRVQFGRHRPRFQKVRYGAFAGSKFLPRQLLSHFL